MSSGIPKALPNVLFWMAHFLSQSIINLVIRRPQVHSTFDVIPEQETTVFPSTGLYY